MWPFIPGERFPYANFHAMNQDWILKVVKEFQDNYSTIQQAIADGNEELTATYNNLVAQLDAWYTSHQNDISQELTDALAAFNTQAHAIGLDVISNIPQDYTNLSTSIELKNLFVASTVNEGWIYRYQNNEFVQSSASGLGQTAPIFASPNSKVIVWNATANTNGFYITFLDGNDINKPLSIISANPTKSIAGGSYFEFNMPQNISFFSVAIVLNRSITILTDNENAIALNDKSDLFVNGPAINLFDKRMTFSGWYYYWGPNEGVTRNTASWAGNSPVISVDPGDTLAFYGVTPAINNKFAIIYHNSEDINDTFGGFEATPFKVYDDGSYLRFTVPANVHYISFGFSLSRANYIQVFKIQKAGNELLKEVNALGDSITRGHITASLDASPDWCQSVANKLNCKVNNYGINAASICNGTTTFLSILNDMTQIWLDCLVIFGGTNDYGDNRAITMGNISDTPQQGTNFYASFKNLIETAINKYPMAKILIVTPMRRQTESENMHGITLKQIVDAELEIAKYYGIPVYDLYNTGSLNPAIYAQRTAYTADGLHPNQAGINLFITPPLTEAIRQMIANR